MEVAHGLLRLLLNPPQAGDMMTRWQDKDAGESNCPEAMRRTWCLVLASSKVCLS